MNAHFDAPASFFLMGATIAQTINVPDVLFLAGFIIFNMTLKYLVDTVFFDPRFLPWAEVIKRQSLREPERCLNIGT